MNKPVIIIPKELRYSFSQGERENLKQLFLTKIPFEFFVTQLFLSIEYLFGYSQDQITSKDIPREIVSARRMILYILYNFFYKKFAKENEKDIFEKFGKVVKKNRTDVYSLLRTHYELIKTDKSYAQDFNDLTKFFYGLFKDEKIN